MATFPDDSAWVAHFGDAITASSDDQERVVLRTALRWDEKRNEYVQTRTFLREWLDPDADLTEAPEIHGRSPFARLVEPMGLSYIDAGRDMSRELGSSQSYWQRLLGYLGLEDTAFAEIENDLQDLSRRVVDGSAVLGHLQTHLNDMYKAMSTGGDRVAINRFIQMQYPSRPR